MQMLDHLHSNYMGIEKKWFLARELVYWTNMNADIECVGKTIPHVFEVAANAALGKSITL